MARIAKGANFRSIHVAGVYVTPSATEVRFFFVNQEPTEGDTGDGEHSAGILEAPHIQAEVIVSRELARWIRDYLNAYLGQAQEVPHQ